MKIRWLRTENTCGACRFSKEPYGDDPDTPYGTLCICTFHNTIVCDNAPGCEHLETDWTIEGTENYIVEWP